ncbi:hypothetical protein BCV69DRAFT_279520 [Microstroma glucosiphilum]|uniref:NEDD8-activating enzyme E1 regulatory subunit n=1 Tax=Pseudomicrostroma glucosiphilum TaxID=1684307 RepID=A0A316UEF2_9BASI|nr:hypothetical protein BCV69DRAFT_279520 [Pseudomicrostroma glucosiphilum]PWN23590.1 hypothetical protein BCV69DRAFT_279520 [Pseudomicrostroma glucosiphilum]
MSQDDQQQQPQLSALESDPQAHDQADGIEAVGQIVEASRSRPDARTQRYDRQLRLWASSGQASLESANVLLIGATHLGAQVLKNLILPGIGSFTVLDGQKVGEYDVGNNFFVDPASEGQSRAEEVTRNLAELNPSVISKARMADPSQLLEQDPSWFTSFSLIIAANQPVDVLRPLADLVWGQDRGTCVPLMSVRGAGMAGEVRIQIKEMGVIETHPASTVDLRLTSPWPELSAYASAYDIEDRDAMAHSHIPFVIILLRALENWKSQHGGSLPSPSSDRKPFTDTINAMRDPSNLDLENFDEAVAALGQNLWRPVSAGRSIAEDIQALLDDSRCDTVTAKSTNFWLLVRALRSFVAATTTATPSGGGGLLPLAGSLPDFKATSSGYVEIQRLYKEKARKDLSGLKGHLRAVLEEVGLPASAIGDEEVESFAKHAGFLKFVKGKSFKESLEQPARETIAMAFMDPINPSTIQHHAAFLAVDAFYGKQHRFPGSSKAFSDSIVGSSSHVRHSSNGSSEAESSGGSRIRSAPPRGFSEPEKKRQRSNSPYTTSRESTAQDDDGDSQMKESVKVNGGDGEEGTVDFAADEEACLKEAQAVMSHLAIEDEDQIEAVEDAVKEMVRSGHGDIASTASLLGGVAAQEAIKIITKQYIPLEGTAVYDGIKQAIGAFRL